MGVRLRMIIRYWLNLTDNNCLFSEVYRMEEFNSDDKI